MSVCYAMWLYIDVAKFLCVTLKTVSLPSAVSSQRLALMKRLDELEHAYPQLYWELEDGDNDTSATDETELASSMNDTLRLMAVYRQLGL